MSKTEDTLDDVRYSDQRSQIAFKRTFKGLADIGNPWDMEWKELHEARGRILDAMDGLVTRCEKDGRDLSETEKVATDYADGLLSAIAVEFKKREATGDKGPSHSPIQRKAPMPMIGGEGAVSESPVQVHRGAVSYRGMFPHVRDNVPEAFRGAAGHEEFLRQVIGGKYSPELERRAFVEGDGESGGYLVPTELAELWWDTAMQENPLWDLVAKVGMKSAELKVPM